MNLALKVPASSLNIAVIGTGIAGMAAAWLLESRHSVTVFEQNSWIGGHSHTVNVPSSQGPIGVDTGFIVYNEVSYPNLVAMFDHLDVPTKHSEMSFSASLEQGGFEYAGTDLNGLFGQRRNIVRPRFWRMVKDIVRFYREAPAVLDSASDPKLSLGQYLEREGYDQRFVDDHLLPMGAAIWSTTAAEIAAYPAQAFIRFFQSHGLLSLKDRPQWRTVAGGSQEYVRRLTDSYREQIRLVGVRNVIRQDDKVIVIDRDGKTTTYDHVVFASHADETLGMLSDATAEECRLLGAWKYTDNRAVLHSDPSLMPKRRRVWSSWNFLEGPNNARLCVTYWMNRLQTLETDEPLFVTLNPTLEPRAETIHNEFKYTHPYFDQAALASQRELWSLQGCRRTWFCGSYFGYGFHEDALQSGLAVAEQLGGVRRPWRVSAESGRIPLLIQNEAAAA
ncbi:MAG: FAD-dependent oxidoreductase [Alphaproteobacteria bacterium]|nr:FAD-dependent oxidoreductase [Alphaproteobacteria bacterium]